MVGVADAAVEAPLKVAIVEMPTGVVVVADVERLPATVKCGATDFEELVELKCTADVEVEERELEEELPIPGPRTEETGVTELRLLVETPVALKCTAEELLDEETTDELAAADATSWYTLTELTAQYALANAPGFPAT